MFQIPVLRRELSLAYYYPQDKVKIQVPLAFRRKFDEVVAELKKKHDPEYNEFDYLIDH
jgi:hypothetical protein